VVGSGVSASKKIGWPDANKCYRYQFRKDSITGNHKKCYYLHYSIKIKFQSLPFFPWAVKAYPRCSLVKHKTPNCMDITWRVYPRPVVPNRKVTVTQNFSPRVFATHSYYIFMAGTDAENCFREGRITYRPTDNVPLRRAKRAAKILRYSAEKLSQNKH